MTEGNVLELPAQRPDETDEAYEARRAQHVAKVAEQNQRLQATRNKIAELFGEPK